MQKKPWYQLLLEKVTPKSLLIILSMAMVLLVGLLLFFYFSGVALVIGEKELVKVVQSSDKTWVKGYWADADQIDLWEDFAYTMRYLNPPFSKVDPNHIAFKRDFLLKEENRRFEILLYQQQDSLRYRQQVMGFFHTLKGIMEGLTPDQASVVKPKIAVRMVCAEQAPAFALFLAQNKKREELALVYHEVQFLNAPEAAPKTLDVLYHKSSQSADPSIHFNQQWRSAWDNALPIDTFQELKKYTAQGQRYQLTVCGP